MKALFNIVIIGLLISCNDDSQSKRVQQSSSKTIVSSAMNDSINQILESADLKSSIYENSIRANFFKEALTKDYNFNLIFNYAKESLNNGDTDTAMKQMQNMLNSNPQYNEINSNSKMIHEFLAICYLRKGEQINCQDNHNDDSCIIPIHGDGVYKIQNFTEQAIQKYLDILNVFPDDMQSRWLLNLAYMTLDQHPEKVPSQFLISINNKLNKDAFQNIGTKVGADHFSLSGSVIAEDFNNDGFIDIFTTSWGIEGQVKLFLNNQNDGFIDSTTENNLSNVKGGLNAKQADYNNDGFTDIYITRGAWIPSTTWGILPNSLLKNNGDNSFTDVTIEVGLFNTKPTQSAEWCDFNNDGYLDLFVANETTASSDKQFPCDLYFGSKNGTFVNVANQYEVDKIGYYKGCSAGDVNNDGWMDLYLSNLNGDNLLFINVAKDNKFQGFEQSKAPVSNPKQSFPCWFFDYNNDGWDDIYAASYDKFAFLDQSGQFAKDQLKMPTGTEKSSLYRNVGDGNFIDVTDSQFKSFGISTMGCNYGDIDNDGFQDFYLGTGAPDFRAIVPNRFFKNMNGESFMDMTFKYNLGHIQKGHGIAFADFDNDGDQDIYAVMGGAFKDDVFSNAFFENKLEHETSWIKFKLVGDHSNKSAIGSKIKVVGLDDNNKEIVFYKSINSGASFGGNPLTCHLGLGLMKKVIMTSVKWPDGTNQWTDYPNLELNNMYRINEGLIPEKMVMKKLTLKSNDQNKGHQHH
jgi:hypothetical protein